MAEFINTVDVIGDEALTNSIIDKSVTEYKDNNIGKVRKYAFRGCSALTNVESPTAVSIDIYAFHSCSALTNADFPVATSIDKNAFYECKTLTSVDFPVATSIGNYAFMYCASLKSVDFPVATSSGSNAFYGCSTLASVDFPVATSIGSSAFNSCYSLTTLILRSETMCTLDNTNAFEYCVHILGTTDSTYNPTGAKDGYIYVPRALVESYKTATNWSTYASQFRAIEDWTVDGTVTGELNIEGRYMVRFFDEDGTLLDYVIVSAGEDAVYPGDDPVKEGEWEFTGFSPSPTNVAADMDCYAQYRFTGVFSRKIVDRSISGDYRNETVENVGNYAFYGCSALTNADFPVATTIGQYAFAYCKSLTSVSFPVVTSIGNCALVNCETLTNVNFPVATRINQYAFQGSLKLTSADFPKVSAIDKSAFYNCYSLTALILRSETMCTLSNTNAFTSCYHILGTTNSTYNPTGAKDGYIYVPRALVDSYKSATNWSTYADQIRAIEDYPDICGGDV